MTVKEELELLRGEPIVAKPLPEQVPCEETSNDEKLCRNPMVSVHMLAYNHAQFIRQAIESVMMQETDFEFELIIGEDCSQDNTREICLDLQKKYPERIRVLWSEHNVNMVSNFVRITARCRGEFIAFCEGDDYWVDPLKLQKQVDAMRRFPNVSICFGMMQRHEQMTGRIIVDEGLKSKWPNGVIDGRKFAISDYVIPTPTVLLRFATFEKAREKYEALSWRMNMGDFQLWKAMALEGDVYCFHELFSAYRIHGVSAMHLNTSRIMRDSGIMMLYFARVANCFPSETVASALRRLAGTRCSIIASTRDHLLRRQKFNEFVELCESYPTMLFFVGPFGLWLTKKGFSKSLARYFWVRRGLQNRYFKGYLGMKLNGTIHPCPIA